MTKSMNKLMASGLIALIVGFSTQAHAVEEIQGVSDTGAMYALFMPDEWNGDLVLYAHGYFDPVLDISLPSSGNALRDSVLELGYAVGYSSFSSTGYALVEGVRDTDDLRDLFEATFAEPDRVYLVGRSMGGLVAILLSQKQGNHAGVSDNSDPRYDGVLTYCGTIGGARGRFEKAIHVRTLFDYFYPGVLPGTAGEAPVLTSGQTFGLVLGAVSANSGPAFDLAAVQQADITYASFDELLLSIVFQATAHARGFSELISRTRGAIPVGNSETVYVGSSDDYALNAVIDRLEADNKAANYVKTFMTPGKTLRAPVVSVHTTRDPSAPQSNQASLASQVHNPENLVIQTVNHFGHCVIDHDTEIMPAFVSLVDWVTTGARPTDGDVTAP
jgi:pimeloyl-ACP methyl ester carboxylesterase